MTVTSFPESESDIRLADIRPVSSLSARFTSQLVGRERKLFVDNSLPNLVAPAPAPDTTISLINFRKKLKILFGCSQLRLTIAMFN